jgi:hypothetical protein
MLYDFQTKSWSQLFDQRGWPAWSRDGEYLFAKNDSGWWRVRIRDRKAELVNNLKNVPLANWGWFAGAPNDSLVAARSTGAGDIYALDWELP